MRSQQHAHIKEFITGKMLLLKYFFTNKMVFPIKWSIRSSQISKFFWNNLWLQKILAARKPPLWKKNIRFGFNKVILFSKMLDYADGETKQTISGRIFQIFLKHGLNHATFPNDKNTKTMLFFKYSLSCCFYV